MTPLKAVHATGGWSWCVYNKPLLEEHMKSKESITTAKRNDGGRATQDLVGVTVLATSILGSRRARARMQEATQSLSASKRMAVSAKWNTTRPARPARKA
jgi:hypothetical protein